MVSDDMKSCSLVFAISHPDMDPKLITNYVKLEPSVCQKYGDEIITPQGIKTNRKYKFTKWTHIIKLEGTKESFQSELTLLVDYVNGYRDFLCEINAKGGSASLYLNLSDLEHFAFLIPLSVMKKMIEMKINFGFEIFE